MNKKEHLSSCPGFKRTIHPHCHEKQYTLTHLSILHTICNVIFLSPSVLWWCSWVHAGQDLDKCLFPPVFSPTALHTQAHILLSPKWAMSSSKANCHLRQKTRIKMFIHQTGERVLWLGMIMQGFMIALIYQIITLVCLIIGQFSIYANMVSYSDEIKFNFIVIIQSTSVSQWNAVPTRSTNSNIKYIEYRI